MSTTMTTTTEGGGGGATPEGREALAKWRARQENAMRGAAPASPSPLRIAHLSTTPVPTRSANRGISPQQHASRTSLSPPASKHDHGSSSTSRAEEHGRGSLSSSKRAAPTRSFSSQGSGGGGGGGKEGGGWEGGRGNAGPTALEIWRARRSISPSYNEYDASPSPASWAHGRNIVPFSAGEAAAAATPTTPARVITQERVTATAAASISSPYTLRLLNATTESQDSQCFQRSLSPLEFVESITLVSGRSGASNALRHSRPGAKFDANRGGAKASKSSEGDMGMIGGGGRGGGGGGEMSVEMSVGGRVRHWPRNAEEEVGRNTQGADEKKRDDDYSNSSNNNNIYHGDAEDVFGLASSPSPPPSPPRIESSSSHYSRNEDAANRQFTLRHRSDVNASQRGNIEGREVGKSSAPRGQGEWVSHILEPRTWASLLICAQALVSLLLWWEGHQSKQVTVVWLSQGLGGEYRARAETPNMRGWLTVHSLLVLACGTCLVSPIHGARQTRRDGEEECRQGRVEREDLSIAATLVSSWSNWLLFVSLTLPSDAFQSILFSLASSLSLPLLPPSPPASPSSSLPPLLHASLLILSLSSYAWALSNASTASSNILIFAMAAIDALFVAHRNSARPTQDAHWRAIHLGGKASLLPFAAFNLRLVVDS